MSLTSYRAAPPRVIPRCFYGGRRGIWLFLFGLEDLAATDFPAP